MHFLKKLIHISVVSQLLFSTCLLAHNKVVVLPMLDEPIAQCKTIGSTVKCSFSKRLKTTIPTNKVTYCTGSATNGGDYNLDHTLSLIVDDNDDLLIKSGALADHFQFIVNVHIKSFSGYRQHVISFLSPGGSYLHSHHANNSGGCGTPTANNYLLDLGKAGQWKVKVQYTKDVLGEITTDIVLEEQP